MRKKTLRVRTPERIDGDAARIYRKIRRAMVDAGTYDRIDTLLVEQVSVMLKIARELPQTPENLAKFSNTTAQVARLLDKLKLTPATRSSGIGRGRPAKNGDVTGDPKSPLAGVLAFKKKKG